MITTFHFSFTMLVICGLFCGIFIELHSSTCLWNCIFFVISYMTFYCVHNTCRVTCGILCGNCININCMLARETNCILICGIQIASWSIYLLCESAPWTALYIFYGVQLFLWHFSSMVTGCTEVFYKCSCLMVVVGNRAWVNSICTFTLCKRCACLQRRNFQSTNQPTSGPLENYPLLWRRESCRYTASIGCHDTYLPTSSMKLTNLIPYLLQPAVRQALVQLSESAFTMYKIFTMT